jgi:hypothetical protein
MTRKHFNRLALELGLRLADIAGSTVGRERQDQLAGFWHGVKAVRDASRSFNPGFDAGKFNHAVIKAALRELNIEHAFDPSATEWKEEMLNER